MSKRLSVFSAAGVALAALLSFSACGDDPAGGGGGGGGGNVSDPAVLETEMRTRFAPAAQGIIDGFERLLVASEGGPSDGVTITPNATGADVTVQIDLDGNGSREATVTGSVEGPIETGASFVVSGVSVPTLPSLSASGTMRGTETSATTLVFDQMSAAASADPPGAGNAATVGVTDGSVGVDVATKTPSGFVDFNVTGEGATLAVDLSFEPDGAGGWRARFSGDGFDFTVP